MAGLFKTGEEMRQETLQELYAKAAQPYAQLASTNPLAAGFGQLGAGLGIRLGGGGAGIAAGDIDASDLDISTSQGAQEYSQRLYKGGFTEEAMKLQDRAMELKKFEDREVAAGGTKGKDGKVKSAAPVTKLQLEGVRNRFIQSPEYSELVVETLESDDPMAKAGFNVMARNIATDVNEVMRDLEAAGHSVSRADVEALLVDTTLASGAIDEKGILFWKSPVLDREKHDAARKETKEYVYKSFAEEQGPEEKPVDVVPHQQSTGLPAAVQADSETVQRDVYDVQGSVEPDAPMSREVLEKPAKLSKNDRQTVDAINSNIDKLKEQGLSQGSPAIQALIRERDKIFNRYVR